MSARKKATSTPSKVSEAEKPLDEGNLAPEADINKPAEEVNEASTPVAKMPPEESNEAPTPEFDLPVGDGSNKVDTPLTSTGIVLSGGDPEVLDVTIEEPDYPTQEWHEPSEPAIIEPHDGMGDEALISFVHQRQGSVLFRLKRDLVDYWLMGKALIVLNDRHGKDVTKTDRETGKKSVVKSRWREDWLPRFGINHTSDHQLRVFADRFKLHEINQFGSKTEALRACGFSIGNATKAIEHIKREAAQEVNQEGEGPGMAEPLGEGKDNVARQGVSNPQPVTHTKPESKGQSKATPERKIAAKAAPQAKPLDEDPADGTEALVVTWEGADVSEIEPDVAESGFTLVSKSQNCLVGMMWYGQEPLKVVRVRTNQAIGMIREKKKNLYVEARYLCLSEAIPV